MWPTFSVMPAGGSNSILKIFRGDSECSVNLFKESVSIMLVSYNFVPLSLFNSPTGFHDGPGDGDETDEIQPMLAYAYV